MQNKTLSIFIDESGDFGSYEAHSPYYIVSMVLHNQADSIIDSIKMLDEHILNLGYHNHNIHIGPIIRRESMYSHDLMEKRRKLFFALFNFARRLPFLYICVKVKKSECSDIIELTTKLSKSIASVLITNMDYFNSFDNIILYYDNGQVELTKILTSVFNSLFSHIEFRKVSPADYKLFQVADLVCSMELIYEKIQNKLLSQSEKEFFDSARDFKKNLYKHIYKKRL